MPLSLIKMGGTLCYSDLLYDLVKFVNIFYGVPSYFVDVQNNYRGCFFFFLSFYIY